MLEHGWVALSVIGKAEQLARQMVVGTVLTRAARLAQKRAHLKAGCWDQSLVRRSVSLSVSQMAAQKVRLREALSAARMAHRSAAKKAPKTERWLVDKLA